MEWLFEGVGERALIGVVVAIFGWMIVRAKKSGKATQLSGGLSAK